MNRISGIPDIVISNNIPHYQKAADSNTSGKEFFPAWNWSAFLFGFYWLIYRRCYKWAILISLASTILVNVLDKLIYPSWSDASTSSLIGLFSMILYGIYGNSIYFKAIKEKINKLRTQGLSDADIVYKTQPSHTPVWICLGITLGIPVILWFIGLSVLL